MTAVEKPAQFAARLWAADLEEKSHVFAWLERELAKRDRVMLAIAAEACEERGTQAWISLLNDALEEDAERELATRMEEAGMCAAAVRALLRPV